MISRAFSHAGGRSNIPFNSYIAWYLTDKVLNRLVLRLGDPSGNSDSTLHACTGRIPLS